MAVSFFREMVEDGRLEFEFEEEENLIQQPQALLFYQFEV